MSWTSWTGCNGPKVVSAERIVTPLKAGQTFTAPCAGRFLSEALYQRTREAIADRVHELRTEGDGK